MTGAPWERWPRVGARWPQYNVESDQANGLVAWWPPLASRGSALLLYDLAHGNYGSFLGVGEPAWRFSSDMGWVLEFDATNDYISVGQPDILNITGDITLSAWATISGNANDKRVIIGKGNDQYTLRASVQWNPKFEFFVHDGSWHVTTADANATLNQWYHVVGRLRGTEVSLWIDGVKQADVEVGGITANVSNVEIGGRDAGSDLYEGSLADIRIYNRALSDAEIVAGHDYKTRWELYQIPKRVWFVGTAGDIDQVATVSWANVGQLVGVAEASISEVAGVVAN